MDASALVPPKIPKVTFEAPLVSNDVRIFSIDCAVNAHSLHALIKALDVRVPVVLNRLAGNVASEELKLQARSKLVALEKSKDGKAVIELQCIQVLRKLVPFEASIAGNDVSDEQPLQAYPKSVPLEVSIEGNEVSDEHSNHAELKLVTFDELTAGNDGKDVH